MVALVSVTACTHATVLRIDSDPSGADINISDLGFLGATPQEKSFTDKEIEKLGGYPPHLFWWVGE